MAEIKFNGYRFFLDGTVIILSLPNNGLATLYTNDIYSVIEEKNKVTIKTDRCVYVGEFSTDEPAKKLFGLWISLLEKNHKEMSFNSIPVGE